MTEKDSSRSAARENDTIERAQRGERDAVVQLFGSHLATVHRFALRMCRDEDRARDIAQESLLTALKSLDSYRGEASFSTWLFTITRSHCGKARRRADREALGEEGEVALDSAASPEPAPDAQAIHGQVSDVVERALEQMAPEDREVILLRDVEGLSTREAADVVGISVAALKSRLHRARAALRDAVRSATDAAIEPPQPGCPDILQEFSKMLEGDLSAQSCESLEAHIEKCPACAARCSSVQSILGACADLRKRPPSNDVLRIIDDTVSLLHKNPLEP